MSTTWAITDIADGTPTRLSLELATLAWTTATASGGAATAIAFSADAGAGGALAGAGPDVLLLDTGDASATTPAQRAAVLADLVAERSPSLVLIGATPSGRELAGALQGLTGIAVLANADSIDRAGDELRVTSSGFGGRMRMVGRPLASSAIVLVRPGAVAAAEAAAEGRVETRPVSVPPPAYRVLARGDAATGPSVEEARIVVCAGRGVAGPEGIELAGRLASALGGVLGATRAAVDSGWIDYERQIGQTGKRSNPELYVGVGVSGAVAHAVGMRTARTVVAINRDPDAPIAELADLFVVGDLFEIVPRLAAALEERG